MGSNNSDLFLEPIEIEREKRFKSRLDEGLAVSLDFEKWLVKVGDKNTIQSIQECYEFSKSIDYHHKGLSKSAYLAHPVRVATMVIQLGAPVNGKTVKLGLLHNILEVSNTPKQAIVDAVGEELYSWINTLTVDRTQTDLPYKINYYKLLGNSSPSVQIIKILDKLDNMFLLCENADAVVRVNYLNDIEAFLLPLVEKELPSLLGYFRQLIENCSMTGFRENPFKNKALS